MNKVSLLSEYGSFIKNNHLKCLAEENCRFLSRVNLHLLELCKEFSFSDLQNMSLINLTQLLTSLEEGEITVEKLGEILILELEILPGLRRENIEANDLLSIFTAQKQALISFIPKFTNDTQVMMEIINELEFTFLKAMDYTLEAFLKQRIESATIISEGKVRLESDSHYIRELTIKNEILEKLQEELKISYGELRNKNDNLAELQNTLITRQQDLVEKEIELIRSNQSLNQFANIASHDLKEPLRMVKMYIQLLARRYKNKLDQDANEFIDFAVDGVDRMEKLIQSILDYAKVNKLGIAVKFTSTETALDRAKLNLTIAIEESRAEITNDQLPMLKVNSIQLTQIFQNLLSNALKYHLTHIPVKIHIGVKKKGDFWLFCVSDNGIGIKPEDLERIFQPFQRLHTSNEYEGIGLGLSFCKKIIKQYGGDMWAESNPGKGTNFFFTIRES